MLHRAFHLRGAPDPEARQATYTAATQAAVQTPWGREVLLVAGCDLRRFASNPVVLNAHQRGSVFDVIGRADVRAEGEELVAVVTYAETPEGEAAWGLVRGGFLRAVSIGYQVDETQVERLAEGAEAYGTQGPAVIVKRWELLEVSNVPIPADANALRRDFYARAFGTLPKTRGLARSASRRRRRPAGPSAAEFLNSLRP